MIIKGDNKLIGDIKVVLLIQLGDIGDVVLSFPVLRALKENFPHTFILFAVRSKAEGLADECKWADKTIPIDTKKRDMIRGIKFQTSFFHKLRSYHIDLAIDLRTGTRGAILASLSGARQRIGFFIGNDDWLRNLLFTHLFVLEPISGGIHMTDYLLSLVRTFGISTAYIYPEITSSTSNKKKAAQLFQSLGIENSTEVVVIQPFSLWGYKEWGTKKYIELIQWLTNSLNMTVIVTGSPDESERVQKILRQLAKEPVYNLAGKTDISTLPAVFEGCRLFIGPDSAGLHIAAAVGTPTVGIFGPASTKAWAPRGKKHRIAIKNLPCQPCNSKGCNGSGKSRCIDELSVGEVVSIVATQLGVNYLHHQDPTSHNN